MKAIEKKTKNLNKNKITSHLTRLNRWFPPDLRSGGNAAVSGDCLMPSLSSGREPGSQDGLPATRAAAYRRISPQKNRVLAAYHQSERERSHKD